MKSYGIGIVDDHVLFAQSLQALINSYIDFDVMFLSKNGSDLIKKLEKSTCDPDILLLDVNMPIMNGFECIRWLNKHKPNIKVLVLSMDDDEETIIQMLNLGSVGYLLKDIHPDTLHTALLEVVEKGHYYSEQVTQALLTQVKNNHPHSTDNFTPRELEFLTFACTDKTYKEIAEQMCLSPKTIDNYRDNLFKKLGVRSRIGLVLYALKHKIVNN